MANRVLLLLSGALAVAVVLVLWQLREEPETPATPEQAALPEPREVDETPGPAPADEFAEQVEKGRAAGELPPSMRGTEVDGAARVDEYGELIIEPDLRLGFEYFLSAIGEEDLDTIRARVAAWLDEELPEDAAREAWAIFERYLGYREELEDMPEHDGTPEGMRHSLRAARDRRNAWLGQEVSEAFFGFEDAYDEYMLTRAELAQDDSLDDAEREARLEAVREEWPEELREAMEETRSASEVSRRVSELREEGVDEREIRRVREEAFGREAADRLDALDEQRAEWDQRYGQYREELADLRERDYDEATLEREIEHLREEHFEEDELRRVEALDRME